MFPTVKAYRGDAHVVVCSIIQEMKGKDRVMELISHESGDVRKHALLCMQKMLVQKHQFAVK